jgi:hypothetical protein
VELDRQEIDKKDAKDIAWDGNPMEARRTET